MQRYFVILSLLLTSAFISACGGGSSTDTPILSVVLPTNTPLAPPPAVMGGAKQTNPLALTSVVAPFAGADSGSAGTAGFANGTGADARFFQPTDITTDGTNFYVTDYQNNVIRQIDPNGVVTTLTCTDAVTGVPVGFYRPSGITTDGADLYVVDSGSHTVRILKRPTPPETAWKVTIIGSTISIAGSIDSTNIADVRFNQPTGITTDGVNLYVADSGNSTIRWIDIATRAVHTLAGSSGATGTADGVQSAARFYFPARLTTDGVNLYVTDFNNRNIRKIVIATGDVKTIVGNATLPPATSDASGAGTAAIFNQPNGITTDGTYLYVSESYNNTIYRIDKTSLLVTKVAGSTGVAGYRDGNNGLFYTPIGLTTDGAALYVTDSMNNTIRKIN